MAIINFSMADLKAGRRFYDSSTEQSDKPREKLVDSLEARQCSSEYGQQNQKELKPYFGEEQ